MIKLLSIEKAGPSFYIWIECEGEYIRYWAKKNGFEERERHLLSDYRDYIHFVGVMGKFAPYTAFLKDPVEIEELSYWAVKKAYESISK